LVLQAEVGKTYVQLAALNDRIELADQKLMGGRELQRIIAIRIREGAADDGEAARQTVKSSASSRSAPPWPNNGAIF
jgi:outer membrane protein TolC